MEPCRCRRHDHRANSEDEGGSLQVSGYRERLIFLLLDDYAACQRCQRIVGHHVILMDPRARYAFRDEVPQNGCVLIRFGNVGVISTSDDVTVPIHQLGFHRFLLLRQGHETQSQVREMQLPEQEAQ